MENGFEELIKLYISIYSCTREVSSLLDAENYDEIKIQLDEREDLFKRAELIKKSYNFSTEERSKVEEFLGRIRELDGKNFERMVNIRQDIEKELGSTGKNRMAVSAYRIKEETVPTIIDSRE